MPARKEKLYICSNQGILKLEFPIWWERTDFLLKFAGREIDTQHPLYVNYAYLLTVGEAIAWDKQCKNGFYFSTSQDNTKVREDMDKLEFILKKSLWVIVESYEWESGLS
jgi:hypothetical protein